MGKEVMLKVEEGAKSDVGRQIARVPSDIAESLGIKTGDVIQIEGKRTTYALAWRSNQDAGEKIIRIDSTMRQNAGTALDETVKITKAEKVSIAKTVHYYMFEKLSSGFGTMLSRFLEGKVVSQGDWFHVNIGFGKTVSVQITAIDTEPPAIITPQTKFFASDAAPIEETIGKKVKVSYEDIGGLRDAVKKIREMVELPLKYPELFDRLGVGAPNGLLLYGPPGTGKTLLAKAVAFETNSHFISINGPEIISKYYGESEEKLRQIFAEAKSKEPTIIFIDEIDAIAPKRSEAVGETERRIVAQLLTLMDGLEQRGRIVVIAATNRPDSIDEALRRGGRFDREIEIGVPDKDGRREILEILTRGMPLNENVNLEEIADLLHGYVGSDIAILIKETALISLSRIVPNLTLNEQLNPELLDQIDVRMEDFLKAMEEVRPSALREVFAEIPNVSWEDIGGLEEVKRQLKEAIEWPLKHKNLYKQMNMKPPKGILLHGPPGTGKTMLARAVANEINANFISIKGPELLSKYVGETEKAIRQIFQKARRASPSIIFFDEIDSIAPARKGSGDTHFTERVVSQLLTEMDGLQELQGVFVLAATNRPDIIDPALRRPGRFSKIILVPHPDVHSRKEIFKTHVGEVAVDSKVSFDDLARQTEGYTGAEIAEIVAVAKEELLRELIDGKNDKMELKLRHFQAGLQKVSPSKMSYTLRPPKSGQLDYA